jgi:hypothetical protein
MQRVDRHRVNAVDQSIEDAHRDALDGSSVLKEIASMAQHRGIPPFEARV